MQLVAVTKYFPADDAADLVRIGCAELGESRVQEAEPKVRRCADALTADALLAGRRPRWHMLGRIQRNKARAVARWADVAHSVDSARLAGALSKGVASARDAHERTTPLQVYLQVSLDEDVERGGVGADGLPALADRVEQDETLELAGLMAVAPRGADPDDAFARLATIRERFRASHPAADGLSAGMSGDLESAIAHGATCVRVGTAILGARPIVSP